MHGYKPYDIIQISDLHIGAPNSQTKQLQEFLLNHGYSAKYLVLNGDVVDFADVDKINIKHGEIFEILRDISYNTKLYYCEGNHDAAIAEIVSKLIGAEFRKQVFLPSGDKLFGFQHGHKFDNFIENHPYLTYWADCLYYILQKMDSSHKWALWAKSNSKTYLRASSEVKEGMLEWKRTHEFDNFTRSLDFVCAGHTHKAEIDSMNGYANSGCWTEKGNCSALFMNNGEVWLETY